MEISDLSDKEFKVLLMKMLAEVRRTMHEQNENFNTEIENIRQIKTEITEVNKINELKNSM